MKKISSIAFYALLISLIFNDSILASGNVQQEAEKAELVKSITQKLITTFQIEETKEALLKKSIDHLVIIKRLIGINRLPFNNALMNLCAVPDDRMLEFEESLGRIAAGTYDYYGANILEKLSSIPVGLLPELETRLKKLVPPTGNDCIDKIYAIENYSIFPPNLWDTFEDFTLELCAHKFSKRTVLYALNNLPANRLVEVKAAFTENLMKELCCYVPESLHRGIFKNLIKRLGIVENQQERLSEINRIIDLFRPARTMTNASINVSWANVYYILKFGFSDLSETEAIAGLIAITSNDRLTSDFKATLDKLIKLGISKNALITSFVLVPAANAKAFGEILEKLTLEDNHKSTRLEECIAGKENCFTDNRFCFLNFDRVNAINEELTPRIVGQLQHFCRYMRIPLLLHLSNLATPAERLAEINRVIGLFRHEGPQGAGAGLADIHNYSGKLVVNQSTNKKQHLNEAIIERLEKKLSNADTASYDDAIAAVSDLVKADPEMKNQAWAQAAIRAGGDDAEAQKAFYLVYSLLRYDQVKLKNWLNVYLEESLNAYGADTRSCILGMRERVITSLRGIDPELDAIFKQAEGPALAAKFLRALNLSDPKMAKNAANILSKRLVTAESTSVQAAIAWKRYVAKMLKDYGLSEEDLIASAESMHDAMESSFESDIKPILLAGNQVVATSSSAAAASGASGSSSSSAVQEAATPAVSTQLSKEEMRAVQLKALEARGAGSSSAEASGAASSSSSAATPMAAETSLTPKVTEKRKAEQPAEPAAEDLKKKRSKKKHP